MVTHGPFSVGSKFEWRAGPGVIRSEVMDAARPRLAAWKGRTMGTRAVHAWRIDALGSDSSHVHTGESWRRPLPLLMRGMMGRAVRSALDAGAHALKAEAERRSRS